MDLYKVCRKHKLDSVKTMKLIDVYLNLRADEIHREIMFHRLISGMDKLSYNKLLHTIHKLLDEIKYLNSTIDYNADDVVDLLEGSIELICSKLSEDIDTEELDTLNEYTVLVRKELFIYDILFDVWIRKKKVNIKNSIRSLISNIRNIDRSIHLNEHDLKSIIMSYLCV